MFQELAQVDYFLCSGQHDVDAAGGSREDVADLGWRPDLGKGGGKVNAPCGFFSGFLRWGVRSGTCGFGGGECGFR